MLKTSLAASVLAPLGITAILAASVDLAQPEDVSVATPASPQVTMARSLARLVPEALDGVQIGATPMVVPNEFVVQFSTDAALAVRALNVGQDGVTGFDPIDAIRDDVAVSAYRPLFPGADPIRDLANGLPDMSGWYVVTFDDSTGTLADAMAAYRANPFVVDVQEIGVHPVYAVPNDATYSSQWHLSQSNDKDIDAPEGWDIQNGAPSVVVAVLDTGVRYYHKDLGGSGASSSNPTATNGNIWINTAEKNGVSGRRRRRQRLRRRLGRLGLRDRHPRRGCWSGEDCLTADNDPRDFNGHGTHCAGCVGAMNNNGYAVASPAGGFGSGSNTTTGDGSKVMCLRIGHSAKYQGQEVGFVRMDSAASALYYAANKGAKIASCSWGSSNSGGLGAAVTYFINAGGLVFKAAGNSNNQSADYLCSRSDVYSVAATDQSDKKASFSSYGTWVDISAPGVSIYSTYHNHSNAASDYVAALSGTSMATPVVAGVAATVWSKNPTWTRLQVWDKIKTTADSISAANPSYSGKLGSGRVNMKNALTP
jgi:subtilisin family serine protease